MRHLRMIQVLVATLTLVTVAGAQERPAGPGGGPILLENAWARRAGAMQDAVSGHRTGHGRR